MYFLASFILSLPLATAQVESSEKTYFSCKTAVYPNKFCDQDDLLDGAYLPAADEAECVAQCLLWYGCNSINYIDQQCLLRGSGMTLDTAENSPNYQNVVHIVINQCDDDASYSEPSVGCGAPFSKYQPIGLSRALRIIGGMEVANHSWPWQAYLSVEQDSNIKGSLCGASILRIADNIENSDVLLTAAHCVVENSEDIPRTPFNPATATIRIVLGTNRPRVYESGTKAARVEKILVYPEYQNPTDSSKSGVHDIALIKLKEPVKFSDTVRPICLPGKDPVDLTSKKCIGIGWGRTSNTDDTKSTVLKQLNMPVYDAKTCSPMDPQFIDAWQICAGPLDGTMGLCEGDSGGSLACQDTDGKWKIFGIASYVHGDGRFQPPTCTASGNADVFAKVSSYIDWIVQNRDAMTAVKAA